MCLVGWTCKREAFLFDEITLVTVCAGVHAFCAGQQRERQKHYSNLLRGQQNWGACAWCHQWPCSWKLVRSKIVLFREPRTYFENQALCGLITEKLKQCMAIKIPFLCTVIWYYAMYGIPEAQTSFRESSVEFNISNARCKKCFT